MPNHLKEWRKFKGLTLEELGAACHPPAGKSAIQKLETGQRGLSQDWLHRLANALTVTPADLLGPPPANRMLPVYKVPLNQNEEQLTAIEQAAKILAPLADRSPTVMALLLQEYLASLETKKAP